MFERFTDLARRVVVLAQEEARLLNHSYIGTEHLLLGLCREDDGVAAQSLESLGIKLDAVRQQVRQVVGPGGQPPSGHIPFTPRAKKVLELALREALHLGHADIGPEHILLGLVREGEGVAADVLARLGVTLDDVRRTVTALTPHEQAEHPGDVFEGGAEVLRRVPRLPAALDDILVALTEIRGRLAAIEQQLGIAAADQKKQAGPAATEREG